MGLMSGLLMVLSMWHAPFMTFGGCDLRARFGLLHIAAGIDRDNLPRRPPFLRRREPNSVPWNWESGIGLVPLYRTYYIDGNSARYEPHLETPLQPVAVYRDQFPGVRIIIPIWQTTALCVLLAVAITLWKRRITPGHCACGYDMTGNTSGFCPECGREAAKTH